MKIFEAEQIREIDQYTIQNEPVSSLDLMERAARAVAKEISSRWAKDTPVHVFAGPGNNGGDALAVARLLQEGGYSSVYTYLFNPSDKLSPDCEANSAFLYSAAPKGRFIEIKKGVRFDFPVIGKGMLVVDGLFGTGLSRPLEGAFAALVKLLNRTEATVVSIDLPSGLMAEDNTDNLPEHIIQADYTFTFQQPKLCFFFAETASFVGRWKALDIKLSAEAIRMMDASYQSVEKEDVAAMVRPVSKFAHKGMQGHGLLIAGCRGMAGAAILSAQAAMRTGLGKLTVQTPGCNVLPLQLSVPEAVLSVDSADDYFSELPAMEAFRAVAVGPGLGQMPETQNAFSQLIESSKKPLLIDADGLNLLSAKLSLLRKLPQGSILTPHPKELERIVEPCQNSYERLQMARELAHMAQLYIVLKGAYTAVICPDKNVFFNTTGNPGMATAGSGDVLTGVILSLLGQGYSPKEASCLGVYLHGLAGDLAARELGVHGLIAGDIVRYLPNAWKELEHSQA